MKTKLLLAAVLLTSAVLAAEDPFAAVRDALARNQLDTAETLLAPLASAETSAPRAWLYLSQLKARQRQTKDAVTLAEKAAAALPTDAEAHSNLGTVLSQRTSEVNFMQRALLAGRMLDAFNKSIELDPDHLPGYLGLARFYTYAPAIAGGGREPAERYASELEKRDAFLGTIELARIAEHFADASRAYELYTRAAATQPQAAWLQEALGRTSEKQNRIIDARAHYEKALALDPSRTAAQAALERLATNNNE